MLLVILTSLNYTSFSHNLILASVIAVTSCSELTIIYVILSLAAVSRFVSLHNMILSSLFYLLIFSNFTSNICYCSVTTSSMSMSLNLPLLHASYNSLTEALISYYYSMLSSNTPETKSFILANTNSITRQVYTLQLDDILLSSNTLEFYNVIVIIPIVSLYSLFHKITFRKYIIKF